MELGPFECFVLLAVGALLWNVWQKLYKSPLAGIPGPWQGKLTDLYFQYFAMKGEQHSFMLALHEEYGPIVHFSPNKVSVNTKRDSELIYNTYAFRKGPVYDGFAFGGTSIFNAKDRETHSARKKIIMKTYGPKSVKQLEPVVQRVAIQSVMEKLRQTGTCDVYALLYFMTFDVIGYIAFGTEFCLIQKGDHPIVIWLSDVMKYGALMNHIPIVQYFGRFFGKIGYDHTSALCQEIIQQRRNSGPKNDLLQEFLDSVDEQTGLPYSGKDVGAEMILQLIAGTDTTANAISWALKLLLENPVEHEKLVAELDAAFPSPDDITVDRVKAKCPFLDAVFNESMRLYPPAAGCLTRIVPEGGTEIQGHYLPAGTECGVSVYALNRSTAAWDYPNSFRPSRFLGPEAIKSRSNALPFLIGPRSCTGRGLAWAILYLTLANILTRYKVSWAHPCSTLTPYYFMVLKPLEGRMLLNFSPRSK